MKEKGQLIEKKNIKFGYVYEVLALRILPRVVMLMVARS